MFKNTICTLFLVLLSTTNLVKAGDLAELGVFGQDAAIQAIFNYSGKVEMQFNVKSGKATLTTSAQYWRTKNETRMIEVFGPTLTANFLFTSRQVEVMTPNPNQKKTNMVGLKIATRNQRVTELDAYELSLFTLPVGVTKEPPVPVYSLKEAYQKGQIVEERWEGNEESKLLYIKINLPGEKRAYEVWLDPKRNWLTTKCIHSITIDPAGETWEYECTAFDFVELKPTIFVPQNMRIIFKRKGVQITEELASIRSVEINNLKMIVPPMPIPDAGAMVFDKVSGTSYSIDKNRRKVGSTNRIGDPITVPVAAEPIQKSSWTRYVAYLLLTLGIISVIAIWLRRKPSRF